MAKKRLSVALEINFDYDGMITQLKKNEDPCLDEKVKHLIIDKLNLEEEINTFNIKRLGTLTEHPDPDKRLTAINMKRQYINHETTVKPKRDKIKRLVSKYKECKK